jgi:hypothetical protein
MPTHRIPLASMLALPDPRPLAALTRPGLLAFVAALSAVLAALALRYHMLALVAFCTAVFLLATLFGWLGSLQRRDAIRDTPPSTATGAAMGYVELTGTAHDATWAPLRSQIRKTPCVWYRYQIERRVGGTWVTESSRASTQCFVLRDASGECIVDPEGAEVVPRRQRVWREFEYRYHEAVIALEESVYVLGELTSVHAALDTPAEERTDVSALLAEWKRDPEELMRRFDANRDGTLSEEEWEAARREARGTIEREYAARRALGPVNLIRRPADGRQFIISALPPEQLVLRFTLWAWLHLTLLAGGIVIVLMAVGVVVLG